MAIRYKLLKTNAALQKKTALKAVATGGRTVGLRQIQRSIERGTSLTPGDIAAAVVSLHGELVEQLQMGNRVHLPGIGYFSVAVAGDLYEDPRSHHFRLRNARVRTVNFRPDKELIDALRDTLFENVTYRSAAFAVPTAEEVDAALGRLFAERQMITVGELRGELGLSKSYAYKLAARLEAEGKLQNVGYSMRKLFVRGEG